MDLNYLLGRHQLSIHLARNAVSAEVRCSHRKLATGYADRIQSLQVEKGAAAYRDGAL